MIGLLAIVCLPLALMASATVARRISLDLPDRWQTALPSPFDVLDDSATPAAFPHLTCSLFIGAALGRTSDPWVLLCHAFFILSLAVTATVDARHGLIPDHLSLSILVSGLAANGFHLRGMPVTGAVAGAAVTWCGFKAVQVFAGRWMGVDGDTVFGEGDVKLGAAIGAWLGGVGGCLSLALGIVILVIKNNKMSKEKNIDEITEIPFGPYLLLSSGIISVAQIYQTKF
ncbi:prepilin peptidase [Telmatospirillum siberiense]|uniref:Prepilin type IV endopeptidase peptidase domain-containing protein n=1 Tax=Telmatospirillum siberiense TaxID=382514 RepID=A0A2N3PUE4_9PROT|nr:A24 family peptidase [Telmatospirillum siberiense]PKU24022.1 hypothetical protein CWS72_13015 [Telmatospirillum siberiense]